MPRKKTPPEQAPKRKRTRQRSERERLDEVDHRALRAAHAAADAADHAALHYQPPPGKAGRPKRRPFDLETINAPLTDHSDWRQRSTRPPPFTDERKAQFLTALERTGLKAKSAQEVGVCKYTITTHIARDRAFAQQVEHVLALHADRVAAEVYRRGVEGIDEPVYQGGRRVLEPMLNDDGTARVDPEGQPVMVPATVTRYSDRLLELEAKRVDPEYRDDPRGLALHVNTQVNSGGRPTGEVDFRTFTAQQRAAARTLLGPRPLEDSADPRAEELVASLEDAVPDELASARVEDAVVVEGEAVAEATLRAPQFQPRDPDG